ncbi:hypothetical protein [Alteromonas sp. W364]|uniref:hypothetical protein n=1 Tax=Alteromonas sp. W364 TaxID=3075610 RepID=UPI0028840C03|nr:hypothetical protein [Alteromonas sp. W364]MDT0626890.1 hypothetical protein [Alteromonas sp. W364]
MKIENNEILFGEHAIQFCLLDQQEGKKATFTDYKTLVDAYNIEKPHRPNLQIVMNQLIGDTLGHDQELDSFIVEARNYIKEHKVH